MRIVILGLSITSSWGNGHATTFRGLMRELCAAGHDVLFLERDVPWYASSRDLPRPPYGRTELYADRADLAARFTGDVSDADAVIVGSYVPEGVAVGEWATRTARGVVAFYDIDTPVTLAKLARGDHEYLVPDLIPRYDLYLSFSGGPTLERLEQGFGAPAARALYCSFDPALYHPNPRKEAGRLPGRRSARAEHVWDLGYMGTYSDDRQPPLDALLTEPARRAPDLRFCVAGPQYPAGIDWPANVERREHIAPAEHRAFYTAQRFTLNITRADMVRAGWSPSVRLFEAAACATPIISDWWEGLDSLLRPDCDILIARRAADTLGYLRDLPDRERRAIGERARLRVLAEHTAAKRTEQLVGYLREVGAAG